MFAKTKTVFRARDITLFVKPYADTGFLVRAGVPGPTDRKGYDNDF